MEEIKESSVEWDLLDPARKKVLQHRANDARRMAGMAEKAAKTAEKNGDMKSAEELHNKAQELVELSDEITDYDPDKAAALGNTQDKNSDDKDDDDGEQSELENDKDSEEESEDKSGEEKGNDGEEKGDDFGNSDNPNGDNGVNQNSNNSDPLSKDNSDDSENGDSGDDSDEDGNGQPKKKSDKPNIDNPTSGNDDDSDDSDDSDDGDAWDSGSQGKGKNDKSDEDSDDEDSDGEDSGDEDFDDDQDGDGQDGESEDENDSDKNKDDSDDESDDDSDSQDDDDSDSQGKSGKSKGKGKSSNSDDDNDNGNDDSDDDDEDDVESNKEPIEDIFKDKKNMPQNLKMPQNMKKPRKPTIEEIIKQLSELDDVSKSGAIEGLESVLGDLGVDLGKAEDKNESLTEARANKPKPIPEMSDEEWVTYANEVLNMIDKVRKVDYSTDIDQRKAKIQQLANSKVASKMLDVEDTMNKDFDNKKASIRVNNKNENRKYDYVGTIKDFKFNFYNTIKNQIAIVKKQYQSYDEINNEYEGENIIMKADIEKELPDKSRPIIDLFFDVSGSWKNDSEAVQIGKMAAATLRDFEKKKQIVLNIFYFADEVGTSPEGLGKGTRSWNDILYKIKETHAQNVVLMTDCDMHTQAMYGPTCVVDGYVWNIWNVRRYNSPCKQIFNHLQGRKGHSQYAFGTEVTDEEKRRLGGGYIWDCGCYTGNKTTSW